MSKVKKAAKAKYPYNDWSPLDQDKLDEYDVKLRAMVFKKFGVDADGDCPVEVILLDRTRFEPWHWWPVPYRHEAKTPEQVAELEEALLVNLSLAVESLRTFRMVRAHLGRIHSERKAGAKK